MLRSTKRTLRSSSRLIPRRAKVICFCIRPESVSSLTSKLRAVFSHFWFGLLFSQFSVLCQPEDRHISYSTAMESAGSFSKVHSMFSEEFLLLKILGLPFVTFDTSFVFSMTLLPSIGLTILRRAKVSCNCVSKYGYSFAWGLYFARIFHHVQVFIRFVPASGSFTWLSAFTEGPILLTEVLVPKIRVLSETSLQTKGLKTIHIAVFHLKRLLRRAGLFPLLVCVLITSALPLSGSFRM